MAPLPSLLMVSVQPGVLVEPEFLIVASVSWEGGREVTTFSPLEIKTVVTPNMRSKSATPACNSRFDCITCEYGNAIHLDTAYPLLYSCVCLMLSVCAFSDRAFVPAPTSSIR